MKIKVVGIQPLVEKDGTPKIGGSIYGVVLDDNNKSLLGQSVYEGYFGKVDMRQFKLGDVLEVQFEMRKFQGQWNGYPSNLVKVN